MRINQTINSDMHKSITWQSININMKLVVYSFAALPVHIGSTYTIYIPNMWEKKRKGKRKHLNFIEWTRENMSKPKRISIADMRCVYHHLFVWWMRYTVVVIVCWERWWWCWRWWWYASLYLTFDSRHSEWMPLTSWMVTRATSAMATQIIAKTSVVICRHTHTHTHTFSASQP